MTREEQFLQMLRATFRVEAAEHLQSITTGLLELEKLPAGATQHALIDTTFRAAHSLKGAARAVNLLDIESACQSLEELLSRWKRGEEPVSAETLDLAHRKLDTVAKLMSEPAAQPGAASSGSGGEAAPAVAPPTPPLPHAGSAGTETETVRVALATLDAGLLQAEEMLAAKLSATQRASELGALATHFDAWHKQWSRVQPQARALRRVADAASGKDGSLAPLVEFLEWNQDCVRALESRVHVLRRSADQAQHATGRMVDDLVESSKKLIMLPISTLGTLFPKAVRDLSRDTGKETDFILQGEEVRIDKRVLEEMKDPLLHLLRNAVDHGIENPAQRRKAGKPARATLTLAVSAVEGNQVELRVSDDGAGIDVAAVKEVGLQRGLLTAEAAQKMTDPDALMLIFEPELSTSREVTEVSGRGLGLAIVREKAEALGGRIVIDSQPGKGTDIRITLPLTLATFRGVLIEADQRTFVIPTERVERVIRFQPADIATVEGRETLPHGGRALALVRLADLLHLPQNQTLAADGRAQPALILGTGEHRVAFAVDAVLDEREVLVKTLRKPLLRVQHIAGATILGSGAVVPILSVPDLLKSARNGGRMARPAPAAQRPQVATATKQLLVAEDSITSRMLLKGILESAGYRVKTAVDGMEAFAMLRAEPFDLVVSDVEMPRMNGFDLASRIRADRMLADLPVILVTALESREDRERGIDAGASAYLVKGSLDQSDLLEAVQRLA